LIAHKNDLAGSIQDKAKIVLNVDADKMKTSQNIKHK